MQALEEHLREMLTMIPLVVDDIDVMTRYLQLIDTVNKVLKSKVPPMACPICSKESKPLWSLGTIDFRD